MTAPIDRESVDPLHVKHPVDGVIRRVDEHYDGKSDVEQDPYGAWLAIQNLCAALDAAEAKLAMAVEALSGVMVGGNHLALLLPDNFSPAETKPLDALEIMGAGRNYEIWCCWRSIMLAGTTLTEITGGQTDE